VKIEQLEADDNLPDDVYVGQKQFLVQDPDGYLLRFGQELGTRSASP
jgi:hypothetical protein